MNDHVILYDRRPKTICNVKQKMPLKKTSGVEINIKMLCPKLRNKKAR